MNAGVAGMPFLDDALLWCPDNDGRLVDLSACLQVSAFRAGVRAPSKTACSQDAVAANGSNHQQNQEIAGSSCDLSALDSLGNDSEDILRQLSENPFELDSFFTDFNPVDVKVGGARMRDRENRANAVPLFRRRTTTAFRTSIR